MYDPPTFLSVDVLADVLAEFDWPAPYRLEEDEDGIAMRFPRAGLYFVEGFESHMRLKFLGEFTGLESNLDLVEVLHTLRAVRDLPEVPMIDDPEPFATLAKVRNGIRDLCTLAVAHFRPWLAGDDDSWIERYRSASEEVEPNDPAQ